MIGDKEAVSNLTVKWKQVITKYKVPHLVYEKRVVINLSSGTPVLDLMIIYKTNERLDLLPCIFLIKQSHILTAIV